MDSRHKKKALIGLAAWFVAPFVAMIAVGLFMYYLIGATADRAAALLMVAFLLVQYAVFFWSCSHLAKAKGYSNAVIMPGILGPPVQLVIYAILLFALPDKCSRTPKPAGRKSRHGDESPIARIVR